MLTAILMASGFSRRMKKNKLLLDFQGKPLVEYTMQAIHEYPFDQAFVIARDPIIKSLAQKYGLYVLENPNPQRGQSESIKIGVNAAMESSSYMFFVGDQPFITKELISELANLHKLHPDSIIIPSYEKKNGNPVIFPASLRNSLLEIQGDIGGRYVIRNNPDKVMFCETKDKLPLLDIDTEEDFEQIKRGIQRL
ncbi:MAG TPA: NTP transferase domain-containing protein [Candidatus Merdenecus merdavium]|nr:NTP transferase domain-containing protein [Candidatus Merdenecus merdavium]